MFVVDTRICSLESHDFLVFVYQWLKRHNLNIIIITESKRSGGKVMFLHMFVRPRGDIAFPQCPQNHTTPQHHTL